MKKFVIAAAAIALIGTAAAQSFEPSHPLSHINPVDVDLNMSGQQIYNVSEFSLRDGFTMNGRTIFEPDADGAAPLLTWNESKEAWEVRNADVDMNNGQLQNYFQDICSGDTRVVNGINANGTYDCIAINQSVDDLYVNQDGDTMEGDLNFSQYDINNVSDITNFFEDNCGPEEVVRRVYENGTYECVNPNEDDNFAQNLSEVLDVGNEAGDDDINMTNQIITDIGQRRTAFQNDGSIILGNTTDFKIVNTNGVNQTILDFQDNSNNYYLNSGSGNQVAEILGSGAVRFDSQTNYNSPLRVFDGESITTEGQGGQSFFIRDNANSLNYINFTEGQNPRIEDYGLDVVGGNLSMRQNSVVWSNSDLPNGFDIYPSGQNNPDLVFRDLGGGGNNEVLRLRDQGEVSIPNGNLDIGGNNLESVSNIYENAAGQNFFSDPCGEFRAIQGINANGTYVCTDRILEEKTEYLNETLQAGNSAGNNSILMNGNNLVLEGGYLTNDSDNDGIRVDNSGRIGINVLPVADRSLNVNQVAGFRNSVEIADSIDGTTNSIQFIGDNAARITGSEGFTSNPNSMYIDNPNQRPIIFETDGNERFRIAGYGEQISFNDLNMTENNIQNVRAIQDGDGTDSIVLEEDNDVRIENGVLNLTDNEIAQIEGLEFYKDSLQFVRFDSDAGSFLIEDTGGGSTTRAMEIDNSRIYLNQGNVRVANGDLNLSSNDMIQTGDIRPSGAIRIGNSMNTDTNTDIAIGRLAKAYDRDVDDSSEIAIGYNASTGGINTVAIGEQSEATGDLSSAFGSSSVASGVYSTTLGYGSVTKDVQSISIGANSASANKYDVAIGYESMAFGEQTTAAGYKSNSTADNAVSLGAYSNTDSRYSMALGYGAGYYGPEGQGAVAIGPFAESPNDYETTFGNLDGNEQDVNVTGNFTVHGSGGIDMNNNAVTDISYLYTDDAQSSFFDEACGEFRALQGIHPNGTFICTEEILEEETEGLNETLDKGNWAGNRDIYMNQSQILEIGTGNTNFTNSGGLEIAGDVSMNDNDLNEVSELNTMEGTNLAVGAAETDFEDNEINNISRIGVNTPNPDENLDVEGTANISSGGTSMNVKNNGNVVVTLG